MKTTKKLISIFLSLLMVLSLIPMGGIVAYAATTPICRCDEHDQHVNIYKIENENVYYYWYEGNTYQGMSNRKVSSFTSTYGTPENGKWYYSNYKSERSAGECDIANAIPDCGCDGHDQHVYIYKMEGGNVYYYWYEGNTYQGMSNRTVSSFTSTYGTSEQGNWYYSNYKSERSAGTCDNASHVHTYNMTAWSSDASNHWHAATCEHTSEKSSLGNHSGGTATCTAKAVCSTCGASYGELAQHSFTTTASDQLVTSASCSDASTYKVKCDNCTAVSDTKTISVGDPLGHDWGTTPTYGYGAKYHWEVCSRDASHAQNREAHSGGTATCQAKAVCSTCNQEYGDLADHSYNTTASTTKATDATCTAAATYYVKCDNCTAVSDTKTVPVGNPTPHSFTSKPSNQLVASASCLAASTYKVQCDNCDAVSDTKTISVGNPLGHTYATTWSSDENQHWYAATCEHNTLKKDTANHTYGTTGDARFTCTVCSAVNEAKKLQFTKADAKAAIDEYIGESTDADAIAIANKAKQDIDAATTVEDVNDIKAKAFEDIKDIIAPDFATLAKDLKYDGTEVKLTKDYTRAEKQEGIRIKEGQKVVIDLNGHTINGQYDEYTYLGFIFGIYAGGELIINDSTDNKGVITGGNGYLSLSNSRAYGGAIYNNGGTVTINGGTFTNNSANNGGAIHNDKTLTINGGVFTDNTAYAQGGVINNVGSNAVLTITGGTFTDNKSGYGGVIENYSGPVATILGGTFTGNTAIGNGGAIDNDDATLIIGGSAVIKDNKVGEATNNVEIESGTVALADTAFTEDAEIGVTITAETDTLIAEGATLDMLKNFVSDDATKMFIVEDGALKIENIADHKHSFGETGEDRYTCQTCGVLDENEKASVELADAKADALDAIKEAVGECEEKAVLDVADEYASAINEAESIEDVEAIKEEAIKAIQDAMHKHSYKKTTVKPATYNETGLAKYTCACGDTYTEKIAKLKVTSTAKYNNTTKMSAGFSVSSTTKDIIVKWGKVADADGYTVYAAYCGKDYKAIKTIKGEDTKSYTFTKLDGKKLDLTKNFKVYVVAYKVIDGKKVEFGRTITGHVIGGKNTKYTNSTKVTVKNSKVTLAKGKTSTIKATVTYKYAGKKHISDAHAPEKRYRSSNTAVATVDKNGKIKAVGTGTCTIYVFAKNGNPTKVTVTVK